MRQYRLTAPGGYEQFSSNKDELEQLQAKLPGAILWMGDESTNGKWVKILTPRDPKVKKLFKF